MILIQGRIKPKIEISRLFIRKKEIIRHKGIGMFSVIGKVSLKCEKSGKYVTLPLNYLIRIMMVMASQK